MQTNLTLLPVTADQAWRPAALRLSVPAQENSRTPTHLIALIDISDSMSDNNKLEHVKHCMSMLLRIMSPEDRLSVITFGDNSRIVAHNIPTDATHAAGLASMIQSIHTDGCTNLSEGILATHGLLEQLPEVDRTRKTLLLILTDGHANRGVTSSSNLLHMLRRVQETTPSVSIASIAYGAHHNADLLRVLAEQSQGAYSIVQSLEDAAITIGDAFGAAMSCTIQGLTVRLPQGCRVHGPYTIVNDTIRIGDVYSGTDTLILLDLPGNTEPEPGLIRFTGTAVPSLEALNFTLGTITESQSEDITIDLTRIRYRVADCFRIVQGWGRRTSSSDRDAMINTAETIHSELSDNRFYGNPLVDMLRMELGSLRAAITRLSHVNEDTAALQARVSQHVTYTSMARGTTRPISPARHRSDSTDSDTDDPHAPAASISRNSRLAATTSVLSPMASTQQRRMANLLHTMSQGGEE